MILAILDGRKTQTRRIVKPQPEFDSKGYLSGYWSGKPVGGLILPKISDLWMECKYGQPGDRLWVRETFSYCRGEDISDRGSIWYWADGNPESGDWTKPKPPLYMPYWASRITLEITDVRIERLQEISDEDAIAEGVDRTNTRIPGYAIERFRKLWDSISTKPGACWEDNPWVWVIGFRRVAR